MPNYGAGANKKGVDGKCGGGYGRADGNLVSVRPIKRGPS